jgi:hypothetical protein
MKGEAEGRKKLDFGGTPLITVDLGKTNIFLKTLTKKTIMTYRCIFKGLKRNVFP